MRGHRAAAVFAALMAIGLASSALSSDGSEPPQGCTPTWALEESFDGDPASPSRALLPASFDFSVTHRTHPRDHDPVFPAYPADHGLDCAGPAPPVPAQHPVHTSHLTSGAVPAERIVLTFHPSSRREIQVGTGAPPPDGWIAGAGDWRDWRFVDPTDPALDDRRIRRRMQIELRDAAITWSIEREDGTMDPFTLELPDGLPFHEGLVLFKTHAYTPEKDGNFDRYTFHWDDIRFDGPVVGRYASFETTELGYLQANGSRPIGDATEMTI